MAKFIDSEAAYRFAQDQLKKETGAYSRGWNHAMNVMKSAFHNNDAIPAADVVPVVRCGECENWQSGWKPSAAKDGTHFCAYVGLCTSADWFCADGERKGGDEE